MIFTFGNVRINFIMKRQTKPNIILLFGVDVSITVVVDAFSFVGFEARSNAAKNNNVMLNIFGKAEDIVVIQYSVCPIVIHKVQIQIHKTS